MRRRLLLARLWVAEQLPPLPYDVARLVGRVQLAWWRLRRRISGRAE